MTSKLRWRRLARLEGRNYILAVKWTQAMTRAEMKYAKGEHVYAKMFIPYL